MGTPNRGVFMKFAALLATVLIVTPLAAQRAVPSDGQWLIDRYERTGKLHLDIRYGEDGHSSSWGRPIALSELTGLSTGEMEGAGATVHFKIVRAAGTLACDGYFAHGQGSGHFTYQPNPDFVTQLAQRGVDRPTAWEQFTMTMAGMGLDLVDELKGQKYETPTSRELARMASHGVDLEYVRQIGARGYHMGEAERLVKMRDHGVDAEFIAALDHAGYRDLETEDLVRVRDHGVDPEFIASLDRAGYQHLSLERLVRL